jgi:hypothetical protein
VWLKGEHIYKMPKFYESLNQHGQKVVQDYEKPAF